MEDISFFKYIFSAHLNQDDKKKELHFNFTFFSQDCQNLLLYIHTMIYISEMYKINPNQIISIDKYIKIRIKKQRFFCCCCFCFLFFLNLLFNFCHDGFITLTDFYSIPYENIIIKKIV